MIRVFYFFLKRTYLPSYAYFIWRTRTDRTLVATEMPAARTIIEERGEWNFTGTSWEDCYIWYNEAGSGWVLTPSSDIRNTVAIHYRV